MTKESEMTISEIVKERDALIRRLLTELQHFELEQQYSIITSFMSLEELRDLVKFQARSEEWPSSDCDRDEWRHEAEAAMRLKR